ncbi:Tether containing UBX domain for GLUT4 [Colletotrichum siamense]|uniref:Tether containing UBX domain for GLUT4 n=1 Tax=Colletotrichum siamense TaxID=690259 RepID=A0A9P5EYJ2_COLSI|nr:Tether containing UBX domain for GLUT4 [Colletotrichum siamense]KAF4862982.1 Tether containing UBX domain for GLUT4 [Colletotrichum siamense]
MSSHVVVIGSDLRRATVKVSPGTYMTDVLQEACKKLNLSSDKYILKHKQKTVDLSIVWRVSGLSPGAKLELVQKSNTPSAVSVALQLPMPEANTAPNGRLIEKLPSDFTIWKVLRQFESGVSQGKNLNITARGVAQTTSGGATGSGQMYYETPVLNIMGRELATFEDFQKTLSQLGYNSGSVLIRLSFRKTEQTLFDAMEQISQFFAEVEAEAKKKSQVEAAAPEPATQPAPTEQAAQTATEEPPTSMEGTEDSQNQQTKEAPLQEAAYQAAAEPEAMDVDPAEPLDPLQPVSVFRAPSGTTPAAALADVSENDYTPTIAHAQLHQARLQQSSQNKRLLSDRELEAQAQAEEAKLASVSKVVVKVRFPDNTSAQWEFGHEATGATLYQGVRQAMAHTGQAFRLVIPGSKTVIKDENTPKNRLIHDYKLTRNVLLSLVWDDSVPADIRKKPFLKGDIAQRAKEITVPDVPKYVDEKDEGQKAAAVTKPEKSEGGEGSVAKKLPKWLKLPGKK